MQDAVADTWSSDPGDKSYLPAELHLWSLAGNPPVELEPSSTWGALPAATIHQLPALWKYWIASAHLWMQLMVVTMTLLVYCLHNTGMKCVCVFVCMCVFVYMCVFVCVCVYAHKHVYVQSWQKLPFSANYGALGVRNKCKYIIIYLFVCICKFVCIFSRVSILTRTWLMSKLGPVVSQRNIQRNPGSDPIFPLCDWRFLSTWREEENKRSVVEWF